jgi:imidazolonepropionase-like amidohydrolase
MNILRYTSLAALLLASHVGAQDIPVTSPSPAATRAASIAFTGATIIDGTGRAPVANAVILVTDGRITAVGPAAQVTIPAGAERVALTGKFIIPGLINSHGHVNTPDDLKTYAVYGVTTVVSLGGENEAVFAARASQNVRTLDRARVYVSGPVLTPRTPDEARTMVAGVANQKVDWVKIRVDDNLGTAAKMTPEVYRAVIEEAHKRNLRVAAHLYYLADANGLLDAGADFIAHSVRDVEVDAPFATKLKLSGRCYTPTLMREVSTYIYESTPAFFADSQFLKYANNEWVAAGRDVTRQQATRANASAQKYKAQLPLATRNLKKLADAGVPIAMGTDTGPQGRFQGYFELMELEMMVKGGLSTTAALNSANAVAAKCMGIDRELGTLENGKWADFVVLEDDPIANIVNVRHINSVFIAGNRVAR